MRYDDLMQTTRTATTRPLRKVDPGIYETADERYAAFKSTSQWNVGGNGRQAYAVDLAAAQSIVARWIEEDAR